MTAAVYEARDTMHGFQRQIIRVTRAYVGP